MATVEVISYSPNGNFLAVSSPDGRLSLWDTTSATISQQYTPSSHLSATCTCLSWCPARKEPVRKKKRLQKTPKKENDSAVSTFEMVAMGTQAGSILLYSLAKADIHKHMDQGHIDRVNGIAWHPDSDVLYSCSEDQHIIEWDVTNSQVKCKWKADSTSVRCICLCPGSRTILSAGRKIQLWDLDTKQVLKKFTGHASPVRMLRVVPNCNLASADSPASLESVDGLYFISCAEGDRVLNVWQILSACKSKSAKATFIVHDDPVDFDILNSCTDRKTYLSVVTKGGDVRIFDPVLNGRAKKQLEPRTHLQVTTEGHQDKLARPVPILAARLCHEPQSPLLIAHGTLLKLTFERVHFASEDKSICLVRSDPSTQPAVGISGDKLKVPIISGQEVVKTPMSHAQSGYRATAEEGETTGARKNKRKSFQQTLTIEDRLVALNVAEAHVDMSAKDQSATTESLSMLLTQGLQSQDKNMLNSVFQQQKEAIIRRTVQRLPIPLVVGLVQELASRMNTSPQSGLVLALWTKVVLCERASYLMTCPELVAQLAQIYEMINTRTCQASRIARLHGKLTLMLAQIASQKRREEEAGARPNRAALVYEEDSPDEGNGIEELYPMHSESEGEWEELSEMEQDEPLPDIVPNDELESSDNESSDLAEDDDNDDEGEEEAQEKEDGNSSDDD